jgi:hypothetical protein
VQIYTKFKQPKPKRRSGNGTHWGWGLLLAVVCVGA